MTDRFDLLERIGKGGMGVVWRARDTETGEIVAVKLLYDTYADDDRYLARFEHEVEMARRISSRHVVQVLGFGQRGGVPYMVMEFVAGQSLKTMLAERGALPWDEGRGIAVQVLRGLVAAHAAGVLHRDVKPSNILLTETNLAKLADFGIARAVDLTNLTGSQTMVGTPAYMAPEGQEDVRSDLYSAGVVLYEMLAGEPPFGGESMHTIIRRHMMEPPDLRRVPWEARTALELLLAKEPRQRPASAVEAITVLDPATVSGRGGVARTPAEPAPSRPPAATPSPPPPAASAQAGAPAPPAARTALRSLPESPPVRPVAPPASPSASEWPQEQHTRAPASPAPLRPGHVSQASQAPSAVHRGDGTPATSVVFAGSPEAPIGLYADGTVRTFGATSRIMTGAAAIARVGANFLACILPGGTLRIHDAGTLLHVAGRWLPLGNIVASTNAFAASDQFGARVLSGGPQVPVALWNGADGALLWSVERNDMRGKPADASMRRSSVASREPAVICGAVSGGPRRIAIGYETGVVLADWQGQELDWHPLPQHRPLAVAFVPGQDRVVVGTQAGALLAFGLGRAEGVFTVTMTSEPMKAVAVSPGGRFVASGAGTLVQVHSFTKYEPVRRLQTPGGRVNSLAFSSDGKRLAAACDDGLVITWDVLPPF